MSDSGDSIWESRIEAQLTQLAQEFLAHTTKEEVFWENQTRANSQNCCEHEAIVKKLEDRLVNEAVLRTRVEQLASDAARRGTIVGGIIVAIFAGALALANMFVHSSIRGPK